MIAVMERDTRMAKKQPAGDGPERKHAAFLRRKMYSPDDIRAFGPILDALKAELLAWANKMEKEFGKDKIEIDGATKFRRGVELMDEFYSKIDEGISRERKRRKQPRILG